MKPDPIKQYLALRTALTEEQKRLQARLIEIQQALASGTVPARTAARVRAPVRNSMSLKQAIIRVTMKKPLPKDEILRAVRRAGYRFAGKDPMNSLNVALYTKGNFRNQAGRFSPYK